ncbi:MAG: 4Fe-4S dicluster domain-containing protein [Acidobacteria bacterium]|nr:MAG: 4Fe-4S dicluster domain-containing protein [Acidobacteriota bacterium]
MKRKIIRIDEDKCTGCGDCIPNCPEGAIQIIDAKARLISDLFCDGLGACLGHCPEGAIEIEEREAEPYDEAKVMLNIIKQGPNVIQAHLDHLREHGENELLNQAMAVLEKQKKRPQNPVSLAGILTGRTSSGGCPGSRSMAFDSPASPAPTRADTTDERPSQLTHWPIQLHLISPRAPHFVGSDLLLAADCVAYSLGDFHQKHLKGKTLAIACPKLDGGQEIYAEKLRALIENAEVQSITVMIMEVPCCMGLLRMVQQVAAESGRKIPVQAKVVSVRGGIIRELD